MWVRCIKSTNYRHLANIEAGKIYKISTKRSDVINGLYKVYITNAQTAFFTAYYFKQMPDTWIKSPLFNILYCGIYE